MFSQQTSRPSRAGVFAVFTHTLMQVAKSFVVFPDKELLEQRRTRRRGAARGALSKSKHLFSRQEIAQDLLRAERVGFPFRQYCD